MALVAAAAATEYSLLHGHQWPNWAFVHDIARTMSVEWALYDAAVNSNPLLTKVGT